MNKLLAFAAVLTLVGCAAAPQDQVLERLPPTAQAKAGNPVNCTTQYRFNNTGYTTCN